MPRKQSPVLTDLELTVMNVLWDRGSATTREVLDALSDKRRFAYTTLSTILTILNRKGFVTHQKKKKTFLYKPSVTRKEMTNRAIEELTKKFFKGSQEGLKQYLIGSREVIRKKTRPTKKEAPEQKPPVSEDEIPDWF